MGKDTTREGAVEACAALVMPVMLATEDWDASEAHARRVAHDVFAEALALCVARFDEALRRDPRPGWRAVS